MDRRRRIPDTTTCTKPLVRAYGDWFPACCVVGRGQYGVGLAHLAELRGLRLGMLVEIGQWQVVPK